MSIAENGAVEILMESLRRVSKINERLRARIAELEKRRSSVFVIN